MNQMSPSLTVFVAASAGTAIAADAATTVTRRMSLRMRRSFLGGSDLVRPTDGDGRRLAQQSVDLAGSRRAASLDATTLAQGARQSGQRGRPAGELHRRQAPRAVGAQLACP